MEIRDRFVKTPAGDIYKFSLELTECPGSFKRLFFCFQNIISPAIFHKNITAPVVTVAIAVVRHCIVSENQPQSTPFGTAALSFLFTDLA